MKVIEVNFISDDKWVEKTDIMLDAMKDHEWINQGTFFSTPPVRDIEWLCEESQVDDVLKKLTSIGHMWPGFEAVSYDDEHEG